MMRAILAVPAAIVVMIGSAGATQAVTSPEGSESSVDSTIVLSAGMEPETKSTTSAVDCTQADGTVGTCLATMTVTTSGRTPVTREQVKSIPNLTPEQKAEMMSAASTTVFYSRKFDQTVQSIYGGWAWKEQQSGVYYFNGSKVWLASSYLGYRGWHQCNQNTGFGYSIEVTSCLERARPELGGGAIAEYDYFKVHAIAKGIPIVDSKSMWVNLYPSGAGYYHWAN